MIKNKITAVLGPTNTGKTFLAIETMLSFRNGMIGFPLRLLAREVYDKVVKKLNTESVALITGEEKIIPKNVRNSSENQSKMHCFLRAQKKTRENLQERTRRNLFEQEREARFLSRASKPVEECP